MQQQGIVLSVIWKPQVPCLIMRLMVLSAISFPRAMIFFCFRTGFQLILDLTALIICGVWTTWGLPVSENNLTVQYTKTQVIFNGFSNSKTWALSIPLLWRVMIAIWFSLPAHSIITDQSRQDYFDMFIVYMLIISNVNIIFGCVQFVSCKRHVYTCINIYGSTRCIYTIMEKFTTKEVHMIENLRKWLTLLAAWEVL